VEEDDLCAISPKSCATGRPLVEGVDAIALAKLIDEVEEYGCNQLKRLINEERLD
jgi:hypothetical protein